MRTGSRRRGLAAVALVCHLLTAFGFPVPAPAAHKKSGTPFPCQDHPCGCPTADHCWAGDCCCFTLEQKLTWAEANGVEPPAHVRPMVESRKARPAPAPKRKKACCSEAAPPETPAPAETPACCAREGHKTNDDCVIGAAAPHAKACCDTNTEPSHRDAPPADEHPRVRWVVGVFAQKCRGEGPAGLLQLEPVVVPDLTPVTPDNPERAAHPVPRSDRATAVPHLPPTPPPRPF